MVKNIRDTKEYKNWRKFVLERDNYTCRQCGATENLEVHHLQSVAEHPELACSTENGITLCHKCHQNTESYLKYPKGLNKEQDKKKKLVTFNSNVDKMLKEISDYTGNTENQVITMAVAILYAQLLKK